MSAGRPCRWTTITARVRSVMRSSMQAGSMVNVRGSTSTKTGSPWWWMTAVAEARKVRAGTSTSSPGSTPAAATAAWRAAVPLLKARQKRLPT